MATRYMDMLSYDPEQERKATEYIHQHRTWFIALGAALIVLGVIAAGSSVATTYVRAGVGSSSRNATSTCLLSTSFARPSRHLHCRHRS